MLNFSDLGIWSTEIDSDSGFVENSINMSTTVKTNRASNRGGWQGTFRNLETSYPWIIPLIEKIKIELERHHRSKISFRKFWMNVNGPGHSNDWHRHELDKPAAVYYIKVPKNSGKILFRKESDILEIEPKAGMLLSFPGDLYHSVSNNLSDDSRISFALNYRLLK
jgi:hypothetical protein